MIVNKVNLNGVFVNLKTTFNKAFSEAEVVWQKFAMLVPSTSSSNDYKWLGDFPKMRKWLGEKFIKQLEAFKYELFNDPYEATVEVKRDDIEDDNLGLYAVLADSAGESSKQWPDEMLMEIISGGFTNLCFDGQNFYDTDHPRDDTVYSNKLTKALSNADRTSADASFGALRLLITTMKDSEGRSLNLKPDTLLVPSELEIVANSLMTNEKLADDTPNPYRGMAKVEVDARLKTSTEWHLLVTVRKVKPFVFQLRKKPVFVSQTNMDSPDVFNQAIYKFGSESRGTTGYGLPQLAAASTGTT